MPGTCHELLKWKFAHLNSVDFRLRRHPKHGWMLELLETRKGKALPENARPGYHELKGGCRVEGHGCGEGREEGGRCKGH